ncbi:MAG TPA: SGNH/GDSL hydrolase family protein [Balneolaceae bacterium]|nr:SGNH/GDSL hydrolase family protein [Balneolaceae bacterium]
MVYFKQLFATLFLISFSFLGCQSQDSAISFLALGDSYTIGERVGVEESWPVQLSEQLRAEGLDVAAPKIIAQTGWTTQDLKKAIAKADLEPPYDLVSLLIGVNDQYQGIDISKYPSNFRFLLDKAITLAGHKPDHVLVLSIPDYGATPFGQQRNSKKISAEIENYNSINKDIATRLGAHYINITPISQKAKINPALVASDGLHPSEKMYKQWVEKVLPITLTEFEKEALN